MHGKAREADDDRGVGGRCEATSHVIVWRNVAIADRHEWRHGHTKRTHLSAQFAARRRPALANGAGDAPFTVIGPTQKVLPMPNDPADQVTVPPVPSCSEPGNEFVSFQALLLLP
jgi:hypothetical protein